MRKTEVTIHDLEVEAFESEVEGHKEVIRLSWSGSIGWGQYTLYKDDRGYWHGDSECLDNNQDKTVLKTLLHRFVEMIVVEG